MESFAGPAQQGSRNDHRWHSLLTTLQMQYASYVTGHPEYAGYPRTIDESFAEVKQFVEERIITLPSWHGN